MRLPLVNVLHLRHPRAAAVALTLATVPVTAPARGQADVDLRISKTDFELHCRELDLTPAQREAAETMYAECSREFDEAVQAYNDMTDWMYSHTDKSWHEGEAAPALRERIEQARLRNESAYQRELRALEAKYFNGLRRIAAGWTERVDSLQRRRFRERLCEGESLDGSMVDLIALVRAIQPSGWSSPEVDHALVDYEMEMDRLLRHYDERQIARRRGLRTASAAQQAAKEAGEDLEPHVVALVNEMMSLHATTAQLSELNLDTAARLQSLLPDPAFADALHRRIHRYMYGEEFMDAYSNEWHPFPNVAASRDAARAQLEGDTERLASVEALWQQWRADRDTKTPHLRAALRVRDDEAAEREAQTLFFSRAEQGSGRALASPRSAVEGSDKTLAGALRRGLRCDHNARGGRAMSTRGVVAILWRAMIGLLAVFVLAPSVRGDWWEDFLRLRVSRDDMQAIVLRLDLDVDEQTLVWQVYDDFLTGFLREAGKVKVEVDRLTAAGEQWGEELSYGWWEMRSRLEDAFETNVAALLDEDSKQRAWQRAFADLRRRNSVDYLHTIERRRFIVDLIAATEPLSLSDAERMRLAELLADYRSMMDEQLRAWQRDCIRLSRVIRANTNNNPQAPSDPEKLRRCMDALAAFQALTDEIVRTSDEFAPRIANELEAANRLAFIEAVDRVIYPEAFHPCPAEVAAEAIKFVDDIAPEKRAALAAIYAEYLPLRDQIRRETLDSVRKWRREDSPLKRELAALTLTDASQRDAYYARRSELLQQHPANSLLERRHDAAIAAARRMRAVFTDEEFASLPLAVRLALEW